MDHVLEGWCTDPYARHEARWMSQGTPTDLVKDGGAESLDHVVTDAPFTVRPVPVKGAPPVSGGFERADDPPSWEPPLPVRPPKRTQTRVVSYSHLPPEVGWTLFNRFQRRRKWAKWLACMGLAALLAAGVGWAYDATWLWLGGYALFLVLGFVGLFLRIGLRRDARR